MAHTFRNLKVWEKAHEMVLEAYKISKTFPNSERYGLVTQLQRSSASVATNIVEGYKRRSGKEFLHFLNMADSSLEEAKYHLILARDLGYIKKADCERLLGYADEIGRMLYGFQKSLTLTA